MPLPNPLIFTAFLNGYIKVRESKWNSTLGYLESWYKDTASEKVGDVVFMNRNFYNPKLYEPDVIVVQAAEEGKEEEQSLDYHTMLEEWTNLLSELGKGGRETSMIGATFHAIRTYAIAKLKSSELGDLFNAHIADLRNQTQLLDAAIIDAFNKKLKREDVSVLETQYKANLLLLCDLGDQESIVKAARLNMFSHIKNPERRKIVTPYLNTLNENIPLYYHENYHLIHFDVHYKVKDAPVEMTFENFESSAISNGNQSIILPNESKSAKAPAVSFTGMFGSMGSYIGGMLPGSSKPAAEGPGAQVSSDPTLRASK